MLLLLPLLLLGAVMVSRNDTPDSIPVRVDRLAPGAPSADASGSTWYCAAGSATGVASGEGAGRADQTVIIVNLSDQVVAGVLTAVPVEGETVRRPVEVAPNARTEVALADVVKAPWASAVVELAGGQVAVEHAVSGPGGRSVGPCASHPSSTWYFPAGSTRAGTTMLLALFNPFPGEASVDLSFETEDGTRTPQQFQGLVLPGGRVTVVDVGAVVTLRQEIATTVRARNGRIIAEQVLIGDGTDGSPTGLTSVLGAPAPATDWTFPDNATPGPGRTASVSVLNPGEVEASVEVQVFLDDPAANGTVEPFALTVGPKQARTVDLFADGRIPPGVGSWMLVRSTNGVPVVAERLEGGTTAAESAGLAATIGTPIVATEWLVPVATASSLESSRLVIVNPSGSGSAVVTLRAHAGGVTRDLPGSGRVVVPAGAQVVVSLGADGSGLEGLAVVVSADSPVVVSRTFVFAPSGFASSLAIAVLGTESLPAGLARPEDFLVDAPAAQPSADAPEDVLTTIDPSAATIPPASTASTASTTSTTGG